MGVIGRLIDSLDRTADRLERVASSITEAETGDAFSGREDASPVSGEDFNVLRSLSGSWDGSWHTEEIGDVWGSHLFTIRFGEDLINGDSTPYEAPETGSGMPDVGDIVQYRQKHGSQAWLPAVVTVNEESFVPGRWESVPERSPNFYEPMTVRINDGSTSAPTSFSTLVDADNERWVVSNLPPIKPPFTITFEEHEGPVTFHHVHLRVLSPTCADYAEFNVIEGEQPGGWRWPE